MPVRTYRPRRFVASKPRHECPDDALTADSKDWLIDPNEEKAVRRRGQTTPVGWDSVLNTAWSGNKPRGRQMIGMRANQLADKSQHPTALFTDDSGDKRGEVVTLDTDQTTPDWYSLGQEYGTTHYPATGFGLTTAANGSDKTDLRYRWTPLWTNGALTARYMRGITATDRQLMFAGGRATMESGEWLYGMSDGTPWQWRKTWNFATGSGANVNRLRPWGHQVPLFVPKVTATGNTASASPWIVGKVFYYSLAYMYEDGSIGPFTPISDTVCDTIDGVANTSNVATRGRMTVHTTPAGYYASMVYTNICRGPKGVIGRVIARTAQVDSTGYRATFPGPLDLRIVTIIRNNTQTTYTDTQGDDVILEATPDLVRIDHKWPRRGKYLVQNDGRYLMCGSLNPNPAAIILAPTGITTSRDVNQFGAAYDLVKATDDPDSQRTDEYLASPGTRGFFAKLTTANLGLTYSDGSASSAAVNSGGVYVTLQQLVDTINTTTVGSSGHEWAAQLAPGVSGDIVCNKLAFFASSVASGDSGRSVADADSIWVRGPSEPIVLYFAKSYMDTFPADEQAVEFTRGGPSDTPSAILNWSASKECERKPGDANVGRCLGAAPLGKQFIVFYERGIYRLATTNSQDMSDTNMRLTPIAVGNVLVASDSSICWGDGWAGCMTHQGFLVIDETSYRMISEDVYNHEKFTPGSTAPGVGEWLNEITRSLKATAAGGRTAAPDESYLYASVLSDQIHVSYRVTATAANDRRIVYDYSKNAEAHGMQSVLDKGKPFGWSAPCTNTVGVMAEIADQSGGLVRYGIVENVAQGRIDKFDTGLTDNGAVVAPVGYFATDKLGTTKLKQLSNPLVVYAKNGTGLTLGLARDQGTTPTAHGTDVLAKALASSGATLYARVPVDLTPEARTAADVVEVKISDDGSGDPPSVWSVEVPFEVLDFPR